MSDPKSAPARGVHESFMGILILDVISSMERYETEDTQVTRRDLVRTIFAAVEGLAWTYRLHILEVAKSADAVTLEEELAFSEVSYLVSDQGKIVSQQRFVPMPAMLRLTTRLADKLCPGLDAKFDTIGWDRFRKSVKIRNRVTHPKNEGDLHISGKDVSTCIAAFYWLLDLSVSAMEAATLALKDHVALAREVLDKLKRGDPATLAMYRAIFLSDGD